MGGVARARAFAKKLSDAPLAIVDKRRHGHNVAEVKFYAIHCGRPLYCSCIHVLSVFIVKFTLLFSYFLNFHLYSAGDEPYW